MVVSVSPLTHLAARTQKVRAFRGMSNINMMKAFMLLVDGMVYLSEIDKWITVEEYKEYLQTKYDN